MCSTGFLFPGNINELKKFDKLYADFNINLTGRQIKPEVIPGRKQKEDNNSTTLNLVSKTEIHFTMAARKGSSTLPQHVLDKMKKNHDLNKQDDNRGQEEITK